MFQVNIYVSNYQGGSKNFENFKNFESFELDSEITKKSTLMSPKLSGLKKLSFETGLKVTV